MKEKQVHHFRPLLLLVASLLCLGPAQAWGGGLSWGPVAEEASGSSCVPDQAPVIVPGPLGSPVRIVPYREGSFLVSDRSGSIYEVSKTNPSAPSLLVQVKGNPLGVAAIGRNILVGNESSGKVEIYTLRGDRAWKRMAIPRSRKGRIQPLDIAVDAGGKMIFVVDGLAGDVKVYNWRGRLVRTIGSFGQLTHPQALAVSPEAEELIVSDYGDQSLGIAASIQIFDYAGRSLKTIRGTFSRPQGVWPHGPSLYVVDAMLGQVLQFDRDTGAQLSASGCLGTSAGHLMLPMDVLFDELSQQIFVADNRNGRVTVLSPAGH